MVSAQCCGSAAAMAHVFIHEETDGKGQTSVHTGLFLITLCLICSFFFFSTFLKWSWSQCFEIVLFFYSSIWCSTFLFKQIYCHHVDFCVIHFRFSLVQNTIYFNFDFFFDPWFIYNCVILLTNTWGFFWRPFWYLFLL